MCSSGFGLWGKINSKSTSFSAERALFYVPGLLWASPLARMPPASWCFLCQTMPGCECVTLLDVREVPGWTWARCAAGQMKNRGRGSISEKSSLGSDPIPVLSLQRRIRPVFVGAGTGVSIKPRTQVCSKSVYTFGCGLEIPDSEACFDNSTRPVWCFFGVTRFWTGMWAILFSPQTHTHTYTSYTVKTGCQPSVPPLPLSLTATVRSSRWGAIKPDNKHSPSIPVCWCCCCWCRAGGSSSATSC